jgi:hypothetical protein
VYYPANHARTGYPGLAKSRPISAQVNILLNNQIISSGNHYEYRTIQFNVSEPEYHPRLPRQAKPPGIWAGADRR